MTSSSALSGCPPPPDLTAPPPPSNDVALSYWLNLSYLIDSVAVVSDAVSTTASSSSSTEAVVYTRYTLHGILLFCGIKQHRVQQTINHMIAQMLAAAFAAPQAGSSLSPRLVRLDTDANTTGPRRSVSLPVLVRDWLLLPSADVKACPPVPHHHHRCSDYQLQLHAAAWERAIVKALGTELRGQMLSLRPLLRWNMACAQQAGRTPVVILIGGTSGSGKSTLARLVASQLRIANVLSTDTVRQILRARLVGREKEHPTLFVSTYEAHKILTSEPSLELRAADVVRGYESQCSLVLQVLEGMLRRLLARGESVVVEGVHLLPTYLTAKRTQLLVDKVICVPVLVRIPKADSHLERFSVRCRGMSLQSQNNKYIASFQAIRILQSHLVSAVEEADMQVLVLTNTNVDKSFLVLHHAVLETMEHTALQGWPADAAASALVPLTPLAFTATKRRLVAVVRQRCTHRSTTKTIVGSQDDLEKEGRCHSSTTVATAAAADGATLCSNGAALAVVASSRARSAGLFPTVHRRLHEQNLHYPARSDVGGGGEHTGPSSPASPSPSIFSLPVPVRRSPVLPFPANAGSAAHAVESREARGEVDFFCVAPPRRSATVTGLPQPSSFGTRPDVRGCEEIFDELEMPSLMGS